MVDTFTRKSCIPGMLLFGTCTVVIQKYLFDSTVKKGEDILAFRKPWFQTEAMFVGMLSCLIVYEITRIVRSVKQKSKDAEANLIPAEDDSIKYWKHYLYVAVPAMCDLCATCLMNIGLFYLSASVWQMLRGSMVVFSAVMSIIFLKKKYHGYHWTGIGLVVIGLVIVSISTFMMPDDPHRHKSTTSEIIMSISLVVGAQVIQASQIVIEEYLLHNVKAAASLIVGLEGLWGGIVGGIILWILQNVHSKSEMIKKVFMEDTIETFWMIANDKRILILVIFYILAILFYNLFGMMVTQVFSAVHRTILEAVRTMCIWIVNVIIHFFDEKHGEGIGWYSLVELVGFSILLFGNFTFNRVVRFKCFYYEDQQPKLPPM